MQYDETINDEWTAAQQYKANTGATKRGWDRLKFWEVPEGVDLGGRRIIKKAGQVHPFLGMAAAAPWGKWFKGLFGKGGKDSGGFSGPPAGATEEEQANWYKQNWPTDTYRVGGPPGVHPGWGTGFGVLRGDPTRPMTPGMAGFLGQHAGGMTNPFGYSTGGWEDAVIGARGNRRGSFDNPVAGMSLEQVQKLMEWRKANKHLQPKYEGPAWEGQEYEGQRPPWLEHYWGGGSSTSKARPKY
jgi:hypothetical protein